MNDKATYNIKAIKQAIDEIESRVKDIKHYINENDITTYDDLFTIEVSFYDKVNEQMESLKNKILNTYDELD